MKSMNVEELEVVEQDGDDVLLLELGLLKVGLQVPCSVGGLLIGQTTMESGMQPRTEPFGVTAVVGAGLDAVEGRENTEQAVLIRRKKGWWVVDGVRREAVQLGENRGGDIVKGGGVFAQLVL